MTRPLASSTIILAIAIVAAAVILRSGSTEVAAAGTTSPRTFSVQLPVVGTDSVVVGTVPAGRHLVLKDFTASPSQFVGTLQVLVDGEVHANVFAVSDGTGFTTLLAHFTAGIVIEGGHQVAVRTPTSAMGSVVVAGVLE
jgi:hypothetical protein